MPRVKPEDRKRAKRPKTRTGCLTCKVRRVKCDETKPNCYRCTSTGRRCDGYQIDCTSSLSKDELVIAANVPILSVYGSSREQRAVVYFTHKTRFQLPGFYECQFWNETVLQAAITDPGLRHAVVALSTFHEVFQRSPYLDSDAQRYALKQYNLAIKYHLKQFQFDSTDPELLHAYLAACMLFICIELLQTHYMSAASLIKRAIQIYNEIPDDQWNRSAWPLAILGSQLHNLQTQVAGLFGPVAEGGAGRIENNIPLKYRGEPPTIPTMFTSLTEARDVFEYYVTVPLVPGEKDDEISLDGLWRLNEILNQWESAFNNFLASQSMFNIVQQRAIAVLKIRAARCRYGQSYGQQMGYGVADTMLWDRFEDYFREIVELADFIVDDNGRASNEPPQTSHSFTLDYGIVGPLYDLMITCRDPQLRRRGCEILKRYACREGLWDASLAARVGEKLIALEESSVPQVKCAADVPADARVIGIYPSFEPGERRAEVYFVQQRTSSHLSLHTFVPMTIEW